MTAIPGGNVTGQVANALVSGTVYTNAQPNITSVGTLSALAVTGNANAANFNGTFYGAATGLTAIPGANVSGTVANATYAVTAGTANAVAGGNVSGQVANANVTFYTSVSSVSTGTLYPQFVNATSGNLATLANSVYVANAANGSFAATTFVGALSGLASSATIAATANAVAGANVSGAVAFATTANTVAGGNVSGAVSFATTANAVTGGNVSGAVAFATTANTVAGANVSGTVANATYAVTAATANAVAGANVSGQVANALVAGTVYTAAQPNITSVGTLASLLITGNANAANFNGTYYGAATGLTAIPGANVSGTVANATYAVSAGSAGTATTAGTVTTAAQANITSVGTLTTLGVNGTVTAVAFTANTGVFSGNGSSLTSLTGANVTGAVSFATTANAVAGGNISGTVANATYAVSAGSAGSATTAGSTTTVTTGGSVTTTTLTAGANTTAGTITGNWSLSAGSKLTATYADLAEYYAASQHIEAGTVVEFGGDHEVQMCNSLMSTLVAGIVTTDPAYLMNAGMDCLFPVAIALQGRVPAKVIGPVKRGDMMVSAGNGLAMACATPAMGTVLGKALTDFTGVSGVIEIMVGRT